MWSWAGGLRKFLDERSSELCIPEVRALLAATNTSTARLHLAIPLADLIHPDQQS